MHTHPAKPVAILDRARVPLVALVLFASYQLPHGVGVDYLILLFPLVAWRGSRTLGFGAMRAWYLDTGPGWLRLLALGLALAILAKSVAIAAGTQAGVYRFAWSEHSVATGFAGAIAWIALSTFIPSVAEDILTRGLVLRAFPRLGQHWIFVPVSAGLYVLNHIYRLHKGPVEWGMLFCFGLAYGAALWRTRTLWAAVGLHWGWNLANGLLDLFTVTDIAQPALAPLYSSAAHLVLLACVLAAMRQTSAGNAGASARRHEPGTGG